MASFRCYDNSDVIDYDKFSSLSNATVVAIFPNVCLWRRSLCSNLAGIDPEKLYRATLTSHSFHDKKTKFKLTLYQLNYVVVLLYFFSTVVIQRLIQLKGFFL